MEWRKRQWKICLWFSNPALISFSVCVLVCLFSGSLRLPGENGCTAVVKGNGGVIADRGKHSILIGAFALRPSEVHSPQLGEHLIAQHQWSHQKGNRKPIYHKESEKWGPIGSWKLTFALVRSFADCLVVGMYMRLLIWYSWKAHSVMRTRQLHEGTVGDTQTNGGVNI